ncbi:MAG: Stp1/IreP family PP2C-type Ser/Thr phosphatase [Chloroflexia bacterium]|nr:Stp1/IreP family PP2C-type Ser/Thr phosphatase [Chloroflexia bacterium]
MEDTRLIVGAASEPGTVRERNEDLVYTPDQSVVEQSDVVILAVADGMGGHERGEVAAKIAIDTLVQRFAEADSDDPVLFIKQAYRAANQTIFDDGSAKGEHNLMGTTLVTAIIRGEDLTVGNVGDSRAYLMRAGRLNQVTTDHSLVAEQVRMGVMTQDEARGSTHKNIVTRAIGHRERVDVDIFEIKLLPDDRLLLSSDGIHDVLEENEMGEVLSAFEPDEASRELISRALNAGSSDNVSAICVWMAPLSVIEPPVPEAEPRDLSRLLVPVLVLIGLLIFIAIVGFIFFFT